MEYFNSKTAGEAFFFEKKRQERSINVNNLLTISKCPLYLIGKSWVVKGQKKVVYF